MNHPVERLIQTIIYKSVEFEVVERLDVIWVGCAAFSGNNTAPPFFDDDTALIRRYQALIDVPKQELICPDWSAAISINFDCGDKPSGIMFAQETYSENQDGSYDLFTQMGGLWLRMLNNENAARLLGKQNPAPYEYFAESQIMQCAAKENGFRQNSGVHVQIEYSCHAEYNTPPHKNYAYIPIEKV